MDTTDEGEDSHDSGPPPGQPPFVMMNGGSAVRTTPNIASASNSLRALVFKGNASGNGCAQSSLCWREGRFSDWSVTLGEKTYHLHAFLLARASKFFESHMSMAARVEAEGGAQATCGSDLTEVLPGSCHSAFEDTLDFIYSENQASFEAPASKALLLLKIADILDIQGLFDAIGARIQADFTETAPILLEQYCRFHIPGTDDGVPLRQIRDGAVQLIVQKFQPFLSVPEMSKALMCLPSTVLSEILESDDLLVANEDVVFDFVRARAELLSNDLPSLPSESSTAASTPSAPSRAGEKDAAANVAIECASSGSAGTDGDMAILWHRIRWQNLSGPKFAFAAGCESRLLSPEVAMHALRSRIGRLDYSNEVLTPVGPEVKICGPRRPILPPGVPPPTGTEIDFCFEYNRSDQFQCGESLRSNPKKIGDAVLRMLVFPAGTDTGVARGSLSVFLEAVPQPHWPRDWEFVNLRYAIACIRWPDRNSDTWNGKRKCDTWTFKGNRLDRGWHDFLAPGEIHRFLGPDKFVCIRGSLETECLGRTFLLNSQTNDGGYPGPSGEAAGSSASRRSWVARPAVT